MTTQELRNKIEQVLGNNIRCLLPSYWWKRLFHHVVDRIDEVEQSASKLIESKVEEVKMPIVESVDELNGLDVEDGVIASVSEKVYGKINPYDCYYLTSANNDNVVINNWDKFKRITYIDAVQPEESIGKAATILLHACAPWTQDACQITYWFNELKIYVGNDSSSVQYSLEELNNLLKESDYRLVAISEEAESREVFDKYVSLYSPDVIVSDAYVKSDSWDKLAKDYTVSSREELNRLNAPVGSIAKVASEYSIVNVEDCYLPNGENIVAEWDKLTPIRKVDVLGYNGSNICQIVLSAKVNDFGDCISAAYDANNNNYVYSKGSFVDQTSTELSKSEFDALLLERDYRYAASLIQGELTVDSVFTLYTDSSEPADAYIKGDTWTRLLKEGEGGGSNITVDSELSDTSANPVQNKVITAALNNKVDKVSGKQLSTEDFTSVLKAKLEGLSNYDDTSIQNAVNSLTTQINTLVSGDASIAIESFNEIMAFLDGIKDTQSLAGIIAAIEQQIAGKQDKLVSGTNIKTINGESILGEGNIVVNVDTSNLATKEDVAKKQDIIEDLATIRVNAAKGATAIQSVKTINGQSIEGEGNITIEGGGSNITVDSELSDTSENPLQNKVIYENLYGMNEQYIQMYEEQNRVFTNAINNVNTELLKKVDGAYVDNAIANAITTTLNTAV